MTAEFFLEGIESGEAPLYRLLRYFSFALCLVLLVIFGTVTLSLVQQLFLGVAMVGVAYWINRTSRSYLVTLMMIFFSMFATFRYGYWRVSTIVRYFQDPASVWGPVDAFFMIILMCAEGYAFIILYLGYVQTVWPLRRVPVALPDDPRAWPEIDLVIPTYNEPLEVVRATALASTNIDWPADKLNIFILDDGRREEFRIFAQEAGIGYITRNDNKGAKAGNINNGLKHMTAPYVAIFDCDHVPTRSFLQVTIGWFLRDKKLAMLQTPHHFYSPDPFERNLSQFRSIPNEGELFYGIVQDGNDFWNATFFCGSCAVLRREALDQIGGIATDTVTEDAHTSLLMQMNGWNTAYINIPQAAGLATERLSGHVKQRIRWARGMIQVLRVDNPLFAPKLKFFQRLCYFNAMLHFTYALPRLIFLTAPLIYLILGHKNIPGAWNAVFAFALPHLVLSQMANSRIQGQHRHSFWNEIYETVLAPYILMPTMLAMFNPKLGSFNVTAKGGIVEESFFDKRIAQPFVMMLSLNVFGLLMVVVGILLGFVAPDFVANNFFGQFFSHLTWTEDQKGTVVMNVLWCLFNMVILGVATAVAWELQQRRSHVRITMEIPTSIITETGLRMSGQTVDISSGGVAIRLDEPIDVEQGTELKALLPIPGGVAQLPATVVGRSGRTLRVRWAPMTIAEEEMLTMVLYSRADTWLGWGESREADKPMQSLVRIFKLSMHGLNQTVRGFLVRKESGRESGGRRAITVTSIALLGAVLLGSGLAQAKIRSHASRNASSQESSDDQAQGSAAGTKGQSEAGTFRNQFSLKDVGASDTIELHGLDSYHAVYFALPQNEVVKTAAMHINYHFSPGLLPAESHLKVILNGSLISTLPMPELGGNGGKDVALSETLNIPAELLVHSNQLTFEFIGHYAATCEDPSNTTLWSRVEATSSLDLSGVLLPLADDLKLLPLPFFDPALVQQVPIPIVFASQPTPKTLEAAGIVASYFGVLANYHALRFPVSFGTIPAGNAVVISSSNSIIPGDAKTPAASGPTIAVRPNPSDPYSKVLVVSGDSDDEVIQAAQALALDTSMLQGPTATARSVDLPSPRRADDAPRWLSTDQKTPLWDLTTTDALQGDGSAPLNVYMRLPPDLYFGETRNLSLHLDYRYNPMPIASGSSIKMLMNGAFMYAVPLQPGPQATVTDNVVVPVPTVNLRPFSNTLAADIYFALHKRGNCQDTAPLNMQAALLKSSYLDLSPYEHYAAMPNLELFANAGFPFTRFADLSQTIVVLPEAPTPQEVQLYLTLLGYFGGQTGVPALRVEVAGASVLEQKPDKDLLLLGTWGDQPGLANLSDALPVTMDGGGIHVHEIGGLFGRIQRHWWSLTRPTHEVTGSLSLSGENPDAVIQGLESPYAKERSIVVISVKDQEEVAGFISAFGKTSQSSDINQSVSVLRGTKFDSYQFFNNIYHVGSISTWISATLWFARHSWLIPVLLVLICLLLAVFCRAWLRHRAHLRLQANEV